MLRHRRPRAPRPNRRAVEIGDAAAHLGLQFTQEDHLHLDRLPFTFFRTEEARQVGNTAWGTVDGMTVWLFDGWLRSRRLAGTGPHFTSVATVVTAGFPGLAVVGNESPAGAQELDRIGYEAVDAPPAVADAFTVWTRDAAFARDLVQGEMVTWLAAGHPTERWETAGPYLVLSVPAARGDEVEELLDRLAAFRRHLPPGLAARYPPTATTTAPRRPPTRR